MENKSNKAVKEYFDQIDTEAAMLSAPPLGTGLAIEAHYRHYWEMRNFIEMIPKKRPFSILEIGCGAGRWIVSLAQWASDYVAVELSDTQIKEAKKHVKDAGYKNVRFYNADVCDFEPEASQKFDIIYFAGILQYLSDDDVLRVLKKVKSWIGEEGVIMERSTITTGSDRVVSDNGHYFSIYRTRAELIELFAKSGFLMSESRPSYRWLRGARVWDFCVVKKIVTTGTKRFPSLTFGVMNTVTRFLEIIRGESGWENGTHYSHDFFMFEVLR